MKLRFTAFFFLFLLSHFIQAQITFTPTFRKFNKEYQARYYIDKIIDARADTSVLVGTMIDTVAKIVERVEFEKSVSASLLESIDFAIDRYPKAMPLTMRINYLEYGKRQVKKDENCLWLYIDADFLTIKEGKLIRVGLVQKAFEGINLSGINSVDLANLSWNACKEILKDLIYKNSLKSLDGVIYADSMLSKRRIFPEILDPEKIKEGIFGSYEGFLKNEPWLTPKLEYSEKGEFLIVDSLSGKRERIKPSEFVWIVCHRGQLFYAFKNKDIFTKYQYVPLERLGTTFEVAGIAQKVYNKNLESYRIQTATSRVMSGAVSLSTIPRSFSTIYSTTTYFRPTGLYYASIAIGAIQILSSLLGENREGRFILNSSSGQLERIYFTDLSK